MTSTKKASNDLRNAALKIIHYILEQPLPDKRGTRKDWLSPPPLASFQHLEPMGFGLADDRKCFDPRICTPDVEWPLDVALVSDIVAESSDGFVMQRTRTVSTKEVRGYAARFSPFMVRADFAQLMDRDLHTGSAILAWMSGQWREAQNYPSFRGPVPKEHYLQINLATSIALRRRYEWGVSLGLDNSPSVRFVTDPTGVKDVFRIRDLPEGKDRREALMTWISDHWRQDRTDPDMERYVRKHLRGSTKFSWRGFGCELLPAPFDVETRDRLIAEREAMRAAGIDKRPKR
jgi:hypothetical protein